MEGASRGRAAVGAILTAGQAAMPIAAWRTGAARVCPSELDETRRLCEDDRLQFPLYLGSCAMGYSKERDGFFGKYTEHFDDNNNKVGESRERDGFFGPYTEHVDTDHNKVGESREREGFFGPYTEHVDTDHNKVGESREREGFFGAYTEHVDADHTKVGESREREGFFGPYTEHQTKQHSDAFSSVHRGFSGRSDAGFAQGGGSGGGGLEFGHRSVGRAPSSRGEGRGIGGFLIVALIVVGVLAYVFSVDRPEQRREYVAPPRAAPAPAAAVLPQDAMFTSSLSISQKMALQRALKIVGLYSGAVDGIVGSGTREAITVWQMQKGVRETGNITDEQFYSIMKYASRVDKAALDGAQNITSVKRTVLSVGTERDEIFILIPGNCAWVDPRYVVQTLSIERYKSQTDGKWWHPPVFSMTGDQKSISAFKFSNLGPGNLSVLGPLVNKVLILTAPLDSRFCQLHPKWVAKEVVGVGVSL